MKLLWWSMEKRLETALDYAELQIIQRDAKLLRDISLSLDGGISYLMLPFQGLFCNEATEYLHDKFDLQLVMKQTGLFSIKDIRNNSKFTLSSIRKTLDKVEKINGFYEEFFSADANNPDKGRCNVFYNLGVTYDHERHIIANTFFPFFMLRDAKAEKWERMKGFNEQELGQQIYSLAYDMGSIIGQIYELLDRFTDFLPGSYSRYEGCISCKDINTNFCNGEVLTEQKNLRLFLLQMHSCIGFLLYYIRRGIINDTGIMVRFEYMILHYTITSFVKLRESVLTSTVLKNDRGLMQLIHAVCEFRETGILNTSFRNCMMHYKLCDDNGSLMISETHLNLAKPLCGLVESLFGGEDYQTYKNRVEKMLSLIFERISVYIDL